MRISKMYDVIIVGGGLAGLSVSLHLVPQKIVIFEQYNTLGGRALTNYDPVQYEIGAGRIHKSHSRVAALIQKYKLHTYPIDSSSVFEGADNDFTSLFWPIAKELSQAKNLEKHTIREILPKQLHPLLDQYPYRAEMELLRADIALPSFAPSAEMGTTAPADFYGVKEGYSALVEHLTADVRKAGIEIKTGTGIEDIRRIREDLFEVIDSKKRIHTAKKVIIATCRCSMTKLSVLKGLPLLQQLQTSPLCRIYAIYPTKPHVWFNDLPKTVTRGPLRYIIPINPKTGLIMISYTDGRDADFWRHLRDTKLEDVLHREVTKEFPDIAIPKPTYVKKHFWPGGCTYWTPGDYDLEKAQSAAMFPSPNLYIVGESVSKHQAWMESALETVELFANS